MDEPEYGTEGARFWAMRIAEDWELRRPFGAQTVGIVDEVEGGIILYTHANSVDFIIAALRAVVGEA
jgi:hypothetical protein